MENNILLQQYKERRRISVLMLLTKFRDEYSNKIPERILHGGGKFKVRINWWQGVCGNLSLAISSELINDEKLLDEMNKFLAKYSQDNWNNGTKRTTKEEIDEADELLNVVICYLEKNQPA
jgi:hypothetical protein